ncbi:hypothetical protein OsJ_04447 [Oryza sativa Japonica Group]|uniref:Uncharacterized protein n=1 Tax=Oryza sativa subsp. japonica TaxID=39947 RepID=B9EVF1_ORYSJ|nr:hypothetical protein OsJ_04447 [Oryza sativa Japonica Group]
MEGVESCNGRHADADDRRTSKKDRRTTWASAFILVNNFMQYTAYFGVSTNLVNYLKYRLHEGSKSAANDVTNWQGTGSITPLVAAYLADAFLGRYWTILLFMAISVLGYGVLAASAAAPALLHGGAAAFYAGLYLVALGSGLLVVMAPFGAGQFDEADEGERPPAELLLQLVLGQSYGEDCRREGGAEPVATVHGDTGGRAQVRAPAAAGVGDRHHLRGGVHQVTTTFILQGDTLDRSLGRFKVPAAALSIFHTLSVILWVALYDRAIVPLARRVTRHDGGFTQLARMGVGLVILTVAMAAAGALEAAPRRLIARPSVFWQVPQYAVVGASEVFTLIGQMEFFYDQAPDAMRSLCSALSSTSFALGDYASSALVVVAARRGGAPGWIPDDINRGHLDYFFWLLTALCVANFAAYLLIARWYTYKKTVD